MIVLKAEVGKAPVLMNIEKSDLALRHAVNGELKVEKPFTDIAMISDSSALIKQSGYNFTFGKGINYYGTVIVASVNSAGEYVDITPLAVHTFYALREVK